MGLQQNVLGQNIKENFRNDFEEESGESLAGQQKEAFDLARDKILHQYRERKGIGTLGEKTLHAILKHYIEPNEEYHEQRLDSFVADIFKEGEVWEIQTRSFDKLRKKLASFLDRHRVTIVYPLPRVKWLIWLDQETGEATKKRKSPKLGSAYDCFHELYKIKTMLSHPNLNLRIVLVDVEEYRYLNGWDQAKKRGSSRCDRIPLAIGHEVHIAGGGDYQKLIPPALIRDFTAKDFSKAAKTSPAKAGLALNVLRHLGAVEAVGKSGKAILYSRVEG